MTQTYWNICNWCKHYKGINKAERTVHCSAFPKAIPKEIYPMDGSIPKFDHREAYPLDNDIQFELEEDFENIKNNPGVYHVMASYLEVEKVYEHIEKKLQRLDVLRKQGIVQPPLGDSGKNSSTQSC